MIPDKDSEKILLKLLVIKAVNPEDSLDKINLNIWLPSELGMSDSLFRSSLRSLISDGYITESSRNYTLTAAANAYKLSAADTARFQLELSKEKEKRKLAESKPVELTAKQKKKTMILSMIPLLMAAVAILVICILFFSSRS